MSKRKCPVCTCCDTTVLFNYCTQLFDDSPAGGRFELVACDDCAFIYYDSPTTQAQWNEFYANHYFIQFYKVRESDIQQKKLLEKSSNFIISAGLKPNDVIADVGCGPGHLLTAIKQKGFENVEGVEVCQDFFPELESRGITAIDGVSEALPYQNGVLDVVCYSHIIEHLLEPTKTVSEANRVLKEGGKVYVELPDIEHYDAVEGVHPLNQFIFEHINHFDLEHLTLLFSQSGFVLEKYERDEKDKMPILRALFKKGNDTYLAKHDALEHSKEKLQLWLKQPLFNTQLIDALIQQRTAVHVWGISYQTLDRLSLYDGFKCNIVGLYDLDTRKQEKMLKGMKIIHPDLLKHTPEDDVIFIGVGPSSSLMYSEAVKHNPGCQVVQL
mgnify:FL=1